MLPVIYIDDDRSAQIWQHKYLSSDSLYHDKVAIKTAELQLCIIWNKLACIKNTRDLFWQDYI